MQDNYLPQEIDGGTFPGNSLTQIEQSRAIQEVQAAMIIAKNFPRDEIKAEARILKECERRTLAEVAQYAYPRGGATVEGPSIRLAEVMARCWGNIVYGLTELSQSNGVSEVESYAWDLETNTKASRRFQVRHIRQKRSGNVELNDPRDIYEMIANQGQRRVRACILEVIPGDIQEKAIDQCNRTLTGSYKEPLEDRIINMVRAFDKMGIPQAAIERRLNHVVSVITETEIANLRKIHQSIKDGMSKREDWFDLSSGHTETIREKISRSEEKRREVQTEQEEKPKPELPPEEATEEDRFRGEYIALRSGFKDFVLKNKDRILSHMEQWPEILKKWKRIHKDEPFPYELKEPEPTPEQVQAEPEPAQNISNVQTAPEIIDQKQEDPFEDWRDDFLSPMAFADAVRVISNNDRQFYYDALRKMGIQSASDLPESKRKEFYETILAIAREGIAK